MTIFCEISQKLFSTYFDIIRDVLFLINLSKLLQGGSFFLKWVSKALYRKICYSVQTNSDFPKLAGSNSSSTKYVDIPKGAVVLGRARAALTAAASEVVDDR